MVYFYGIRCYNENILMYVILKSGCKPTLYSYVYIAAGWQRKKRMEVLEMAKYVEEAVAKIVTELIAGKGLELVAVEYVKERDWYLRVFIDKEGGIEIDDCQELSEKLEEILDAKNIIADSYILEVSSPGLDRVLKTDQDFAREIGKMVEVSFYAPIDGEKILIGKLTGRDAAGLTIDEDETIPMDKIAQVRLHIEF